jgi:Domain of unknown function (DUF1971)
MNEAPRAVPYKCTSVFDENTLPAGLRREHRTKPGVWCDRVSGRGDAPVRMLRATKAISKATPRRRPVSQEALTQLENTMRERDAYLQQRDIAIGERNLALAEIERLKRQV